MKRIIAMAVLLLAASPVAAQFSHAYDPNYVDFSAKMDTLAQIEATNFNAGLLNADPFEDFYLVRDEVEPALLRFGGSLIFDNTLRRASFNLPYLRVPLYSASVPDIIGVGGSLTVGPSLFKGHECVPIF